MTQKRTPIEVPETPITTATFKAQAWEKKEETLGEETFNYWALPLPKDNPDDEAPCLISSADDEWEELGLQEGFFVAELYQFNGLGYVESEEEIEILYRVLTGKDIYEK